MGEGDKREGSEDLFEDLDKFFAPIKDVDWPEPGEPETPAERVPEADSGREALPAESPAPDEETTAPVTRPSGDQSESPDTVWYDTEEMEPVDVRSPSETRTSDEPIVLEESPASAPNEPSDDAWTEPPSEEDVEAAAEHFAESIRSEQPQDEEEEAVWMSEEDGAEPDAGETEEDILSDLDAPAEVPPVRVGAEGLGGPSWQEPTSVEIGADLERRGERDLPAAFIVGLGLAALAFGSLLFGKPVFAVVAGLILLVAQGELFGVMHAHHKQPATAVGLTTGALILWSAYEYGEGAVLAMCALGVMATFLWFMAVPALQRKETLLNVGLTAFNIAYIPVLGSFLLLALNLGPEGKDFVLWVIALTFIFDALAFLAGTWLGGWSIQRALAPDTSPKKSWEGVIVAALGTIVVSLAFVGRFVQPFEGKQLDLLLLAIVISLAATFGDLAESLIKRDLGIKDMGNVLPGHGGVLDRVDSLLFVAPAAYFLFRVLFA